MPPVSCRSWWAFFFFSSRRRHTRLTCDWSSDVCSSDLGNEIAGHTLTHAHLKHLKAADAKHEVCGDRVNLYNHGFQPTSFAYPFGEFDAGVQQIVQIGRASCRERV